MKRPAPSLLLAVAALAGLAAVAACEVVSVTAVDVMLVAVSPLDGTIHPGESLRLRVKLEDSEGNSLKDRPITWSSGNRAVAAVDSTGLVEALAVGTTAVRATSGRAVGEATITVRARPAASVASIDYQTEGGSRDDRQLRVTIRIVNQEGEPLSGAGVGGVVTSDQTGQSWVRAGATGSDGRVVLSVNQHPGGCFSTRILAVTVSGFPWDRETPDNSFCAP